jgi:hypothetical protein
MIYRVFYSTRIPSYKNLKREKNETVNKRAIRMGEERNEVSKGVEDRFIWDMKLC